MIENDYYVLLDRLCKIWILDFRTAYELPLSNALQTAELPTIKNCTGWPPGVNAKSKTTLTCRAHVPSLTCCIHPVLVMKLLACSYASYLEEGPSWKGPAVNLSVS